jgi:glycosyltransferase involved in cell wall biosynthesis
MSIDKDLQAAVEIQKELGWNGLWRAIRRRVSRSLDSENAWGAYKEEARLFSTLMDFSKEDLEHSLEVQRMNRGPLEIRTITWFLPEFQHPFYGGIHTILRFADYFRRAKGVENRFAVLGNSPEGKIADLIRESFPGLAGGRVQSISIYGQVGDLESSDVGIATLWGTAYFLLRFNQVKRKFYFLQDIEPLFYPAGSTSAQVEATYSFGYYGIANTPTIKRIYKEEYGGEVEYFYPCVDTGVFHPPADHRSQKNGPPVVFFYGRPQHPRNGFEIGAQALRLLKKRLGNQVRIVSAGDNWHPREYDLKGVVENYGLLNYQETAELYRSCRVGLIMMFTRHPSYLPLELMASGCLVVTNFNPATTWLLKDKENCLLSRPSATWLSNTIEHALDDSPETERIASNACQLICDQYGDWDNQMEKIFRYMMDPDEKPDAK